MRGGLSNRRTQALGFANACAKLVPSIACRPFEHRRSTVKVGTYAVGILTLSLTAHLTRPMDPCTRTYRSRVLPQISTSDMTHARTGRWRWEGRMPNVLVSGLALALSHTATLTGVTTSEPSGSLPASASCLGSCSESVGAFRRAHRVA